jgi:hypothetical protein
MNLLGKIFVIVILIMSLVFMGLAMAVYATHKNWKQVSDKLNDSLSKAKAENEQLVTAHNRETDELKRENTAQLQQAAKLEAERVALTDRLAQVQAERDNLVQNQRDHIAALASTQAINKGLGDEVTRLRDQIKTVQLARDNLFKKALDATEAVQQASGEYNRMRELNEQLTKEVAGQRVVMQANSINPDTPPGSVVPTVEGVVSKIERKAGGQLVEVTIGDDDGLKVGNTLDIYRGSKYLGRVEIIETSPDKSVGRVDRQFQQGQIQEGDRVATRIKL